MMFSWRNWTLAGALAISLIGCWFVMLRRNKKKWRYVGTVEQIFIYPIKSGKYIELQEATVHSQGFVHLGGNGLLPIRDRSLVVYEDTSFKFAALKNNPRIVYLSAVGINEETIRLSCEASDINETFDLHVSSLNKSASTRIVKIYEFNVPTTDCGDEAAMWISKVVQGKDAGLRLGFWSDHFTVRRSAKDTSIPKLYKKIRPVEDTGTYSDLSSFLLVNKASVEDLKMRITSDQETAVGALNFRPNLVISSNEPYIEDNWDWVRIGDDAVFRNFKLCTRCTNVNVNPVTGKRNSNMEPLKTLRKYRQHKDPKLREAENHSPIMGIYIGLHLGEHSLIKIGDPVYVTLS